MSRVFFIVCCVSLFLTVTSSGVFAQVEDEDIAAGLENCFVYYDYGKVSVHIATDISEYAPGDTANVRGTIVNNNTFPLTDIILYAQLRRVNQSYSFSQNGHYLIESMRLAEKMNFLPGETKAVSAAIPIRAEYMSGSYQLQYYIFSSQGFHYAGRSFLEEDFAGNSSFTISGGQTSGVYFDINSLTVNNEPHTLREIIQEYPQSPLTLQARIADERTEKHDLPVTVKFYSFEETGEQNLVTTQQANYSAETGLFQVTFTPPGAGAYVMVATLGPSYATELKYRFAHAGTVIHSLRINDLGVTQYPATADARAYVCFHSPASQATLPMTVTLKVFDSDEKIVEQKKITRQFSGDVHAISIPLTRLVSPDDFRVQAEVSWQDGNSPKRSQWSSQYGCDTFRQSPQELFSTYQAENNTLNIRATNICGQEIQTGGYVESIRIRAADGSIKKEWYNQNALTQDISLDGLPEGLYAAEIRSGNQTKTVDFAVAAASFRRSSRSRLIWMFPLVIMGIAGAWYYRHKHRSKKQSEQRSL